MRPLFLFCFILLSLTTPALAADYTFEKGHTRVLFDINHLGFTMMNGRFHEVEGSYSFDKDKPEQASINMIIKTDSVDMDHEILNEKLRSEQFLDAKNFPKITFNSKSIKVTGKNRAKLTGDVSLHGVTKPITFDVSYNRGAVHPVNGKYTTGFTAIGALKRSDFGVNALLPKIGDDVLIRIEVEGQRVKGEEPEPAEENTPEERPAFGLTLPGLNTIIPLERPTVND